MKKILFVDDERCVLDGLRRMLRGHRREWDMAFLESGEAALAALEEDGADVLVSDMRMPGMDGSQLLARVQQDYPSTVRIILSGHAEEEAALRAARVTHQFLSKPCDPELLEQVVGRACALRDSFEHPAMRSLIGGIGALPPAPRVYSRLCGLLADPEVDLNRVAEVVEGDVGLTTKILQLVNSSFFGFAREVEGIRQAAVYLGAEMLRSLVLSIEVFQSDTPLAASYNVDLEREHALRTARVARQISPNKKTGEMAYLAALLHDVGKLVLAARLGEEFEEVVARTTSQRQLSTDVERDVFGVSHAEVGAYLLGTWGFPYPIVEAVANHHAPSAVGSDSFDLVGILHVADIVAMEAAGSPSTEVEPLDLQYLGRVGVVESLDDWRREAIEHEAARREEVA